MGTILDEIVEHKRRELAERRGEPVHDLEPAEAGRFEAAFRQGGFPRMMLEIKPASPSAGVISEKPDLDAILSAYNRFGSAISVLTDEKYFNGSLDLLKTVADRTSHPVLRKDFILDACQIAEARQAGASAVLLIVKILDDDLLETLAETARKLGLTPVIEIQNDEELERALGVEPSVLLINNRNLSTFEIDLETTKRLAPNIPADLLKISASGISSRQEIETLQPFCDGFLIGSVLMKLSPGEMTKKLEELAGV